MVFSTLPGASAGFSRSLPSGVRTNTTAIGETLALVGPILARSMISSSRASGTGASSHPFWGAGLAEQLVERGVVEARAGDGEGLGVVDGVHGEPLRFSAAALSEAYLGAAAAFD